MEGMHPAREGRRAGRRGRVRDAPGCRKQDLRDVFERQATDRWDGCGCVWHKTELFCLERVALLEVYVALLRIMVVVVGHGVDYGECTQCTAGVSWPLMEVEDKEEGEGEKADQARSAAWSGKRRE